MKVIPFGFFNVGGGITPFPNTYSLDFDGVDDYVDCGHVDALISATTFTISVWFKLDDAVGGYDVIVSQSQLAGRLNIYHQPGELGFQVMDLTICYLAIDFTSNDWTHVAMVFDGSQGGLIPGPPYYQPGLQCYLNGSKITTFTDGLGIVPAVSAALTNSLLIGKYEIAAGYELGGNVDELSIWSTALTDADISTLYNSGTPTNLNTALATTPVIWYRMGDSGTFFNGNWELKNQPQLDNWSSHSMNFDGIDNYVNCGAASLGITTAITISAWVKPTVLDPSPSGGVIDKYATGPFSGWSIWQSTAFPGKWRASFGIEEPSNPGVYIKTEVEFDVPNTDWQHVVATFDTTGDLKLYHNGSLENTDPNEAFSIINTNLEEIILGARSDTPAGEYAGFIDEVAIWDVALDLATIASIFNAGEPNDLTLAASYTTGGGTDKSGDLQGYWRMGEDAMWDGVANELTIPDASTNSNDGTSSGMAEEDKINNAPGNINQGLSDGMGETAPSGRSTDVP